MKDRAVNMPVGGLDTLPAESLMRLVAPFAGERRRGGAEDGLAVQDSVSAATGCGTATGDTFRLIVERWRRAREVYHDGEASAVFGAGSSPAEGVTVRRIESGADDGADAAGSADTAGSDGADVSGADSVGMTPFAPVQDVSVRDSLAGDALRDSLASSLRDTLAVQDVQEAMPVTVAQTVQSERDAERRTDGEALAATVFDVLAVGITLVYMFCLYRYFDDVVALFRSVFRRSVMQSGRVIERRSSDIFYGFLGRLFMLGTAFVGVLAAGWALRHAEAGIPDGGVVWVPLLAVGAFFAVTVLQYVTLAGVGWITQSLATVNILLRIRLIYFVLATVMVAPVVLIAQLAADAASDIWLTTGYVAAAVAFMFFLRESMMLFISKKISILHWFLYLCTIEIVPLSLLWQVIIRLRV